MQTLAALQRDFQAMILGETPQLSFGKSGITVAQSCHIYRRNYQENHILALMDTFQSIEKLVGRAYFRQMAKRYIQQYPSQSADLNDYGAHFPDFIAATIEICTTLPYLADVARFDWCYFQAVRSPVQPAIDLQLLQQYSIEQQLTMQLTLLPSVQLVQSAFPIYDIWQVNQQCLDTVDMGAGGQSVVIWQQADGIQVNALSATEYQLLATWQKGVLLGDSLQAILPQAQAEQVEITELFAQIYQKQIVGGLRPCTPSLMDNEIYDTSTTTDA